jgi:signal transduction histidine kinase
MSVTILTQTDSEGEVFLQALQGHVPGLIELGRFAEAPQLTLADTVQVVVIEHRVPDIDGLGLVDWLRQQRPRLPLVLVVHGGNTSFAVQAIRRGLADYVRRDQLQWLGPVVREWILAPWNLCWPHRHLEELGLLVGPTIHELNNIFTPLQLGLDLLQNPMNPERRSVLLEALSESVQRGAELGGQVLKRERLRREDCSWVAMDELGQRLVEERHSPETPIVFTTEPDLPPLWADSIQMYHLMRLSLRLKPGVEPTAPEAKGRPLQLELRSLGGGSRDTTPLGKLVESWMQLTFTYPSQPETSPMAAASTSFDIRLGQTGFELLMIRGIVRRHHGRMDVASQPGEGTSLTIWLPLAQPEEEDSGDDTAGRR